MLFTRDGSEEFFVNLPMPCVKAAITDHFIMLFGDMADEAFYELHNRDGLFHISVIFMPVVMESDKVTAVFINPGSGNHRPPEITPDIFHHGSGVTSVWLCIDIEAFLVLPVTACLHLFERAADHVFHFIEKGGTESIAQVSIVKVVDIAPGTVVAVAAF